MFPDRSAGEQGDGTTAEPGALKTRTRKEPFKAAFTKWGKERGAFHLGQELPVQQRSAALSHAKK